MDTYTKTCLIGVDIGGTKIDAAAANLNGEILARIQAPTDVSSPDGTLQSIMSVIDDLLQTSITSALAIGIGIPGQVQDGVVDLAVNLNLSKFPLGKLMEERYRVPCRVENDVRTAALGALAYLRKNFHVESLAYLSIGTGIAAGIVLDGEVYTGKHRMAGEIGHIPVDPDGPLCKCGSRGCLEVFASGPGIARMAQKALSEEREGVKTSEFPVRSTLHGVEPLTAPAVFQAAGLGDELAIKVIDRAAGYLASAIYSLALNYDVEKVALGGGVTRAGDLLFLPIRKHLDSMGKSSALARRMLPGDMVIFLPPDYSPGIWGAIQLARTASQRPNHAGSGTQAAENE